MWRVVAFLAGLAVVVLATCSGIEAYGRVLQWVHMIEHLLLIMVAPPLLALGSPLQLLADASRAAGAGVVRAVLARPVVEWLTSPPAAAIGYAVAVVGVHLTGLMVVVVSGEAVHVAEELVYLGAGYLLFQLVFGVTPSRWQLTYPGRLALLALVSPVDAVVGVVMLQTGTISIAGSGGHSVHGVVPRPDWALPAADDTIAAGSIMWAGGTGIMAFLMVVVALAWLHGRQPVGSSPSWTEKARTSTFAAHTGRPEAAGDVDTDQEALDAYNAWLRRLDATDRSDR